MFKKAVCACVNYWSKLYVQAWTAMATSIAVRQLQPLQNQQITSPVTFSAYACILNVVQITPKQPALQANHESYSWQSIIVLASINIWPVHCSDWLEVRWYDEQIHWLDWWSGLLDWSDVLNCWTGVMYTELLDWIAGLDCWTGLLDWIDGLDCWITIIASLFKSHQRQLNDWNGSC